MLKEFSKKFSTSVCKIADKTPASVLVLSGSIVTLLLYAKRTYRRYKMCKQSSRRR